MSNPRVGERLPELAAFAHRIGQVLGLDSDRVVPDAELLNDLDFDSMDMVELLAVIAELGGDLDYVSGDWSTLTIREVYWMAFVARDA